MLWGKATGGFVWQRAEVREGARGLNRPLTYDMNQALTLTSRDIVSHDGVAVVCCPPFSNLLATTGRLRRSEKG